MNLDQIDQRIIRALHQDGRVTVRALSELVGLSQPSVAERIRRLCEADVIRFTIVANPKILGYPITAIVRISPLPGALSKVEALIREIKEITHCDKVTGTDAFICRLHLSSIDILDDILSKITQDATTNTSIVKSSPVEGRLLPILGIDGPKRNK